ncbi:centlein [Eleutherodactylus coqui]|uniref:centlein n=1 Tax=Eleutherodactylus coqui TaxID=57060 RepID=UPI00346213E5
MAAKPNAEEHTLQLEEEVSHLTEELSQCQADKEFVWSLWKRLQVSNPDLTQAIALVVDREKNKAETKDRKVLEILQTKDSKIQDLEQRASAQQQEINNLVQRKIAVDEENALLRKELDDLQQKLKDKSRELKITKDSSQEEEEQRTTGFKNLEKEKEKLSKKCADLLGDLEKARKQEAQWKAEKSGIDAKIKALELNLKEAGNQMETMHNKINGLSSQAAVKQTELAQKELDVARLRKELQELQNLYKQSNEHAAQQAELVQQLQMLNTDTQRVLRSQEEAHITETFSYQKFYNDLNACYETAKSSETQLRQSNIALTEQLLQKEQHISQLQVKLQEALNALPKSPQEPQDLEHPSLVELELIIASQKSEIKFLQDKLKAANLKLTQVNNCRRAALESSILRAGITHEVQPVKRSRSLSPKGFSRESEELKKLKIAEKRIEHLEKTLQIKVQENEEVRKAHEQRKQRLLALQTAYRTVKEQMEQTEGDGARKKFHKSRLSRADPSQLRQEDSDAVWNELAYFKRENKKLLVEKLNLEEEIDQLKVQISVDKATIQELNGCLQQEREELLFRLGKEEDIQNSTPRKSVEDNAQNTLKKVSRLEKQLIELELVARKLKEANEELTKQNTFFKKSINCLQKDVDLKEQKMQEMNWEVLQVNRTKEALEKRKDDLNREVASLKKLLAGSNKLGSRNRELVKQVHFLQHTLDKAIASAPAVPKEGNRQGRRKELGNKVKQDEARKISLRRHQAFLNQSIKVMSSVFENFSKDGWEDVSEDSDAESESSESMGQVITPTTSSSAEEGTAVEERNHEECQPAPWRMQDGLPGRASKKLSRKRCNFKLKCNPSTVRVRKQMKQKSCPGASLTSLLGRVASLQHKVSVLHKGKEAAIASMNELKKDKIKLASELQLAHQRLQISKQMAKTLCSDIAGVQREKENLKQTLEQMTEQLSQAKRSLETMSPVALDQPVVTPITPSKATDVEVKQLQTKLKNMTVEMAKQSVTIKAMKNEVQEKEERIRELQERVARMERDVNMKRHLIEDLKTRLKTYQENERPSREMLESLERKLKTMTDECSHKKTSIDSLKQRLGVIRKEKTQYEQMYYKRKDDLDKRNAKVTDLESKVTEAERTMSELEKTATQQLHNLAMQSEQSLEVLQNKLLRGNKRIDEFVMFVQSLAKDLQVDVCEMRNHVRQAKVSQESESRPSKESVHRAQSLAASILNISHSDLSDILEAPDEEEIANVKRSVEYDKEWMNHIMKLLEGQTPFASFLMDAIRTKLREKERLTEEYNVVRRKDFR